MLISCCTVAECALLVHRLPRSELPGGPMHALAASLSGADESVSVVYGLRP